MGLKCMQNICKNTTQQDKKHVKNYQNKLFFVLNLGVKTTKNQSVRSWCGPEAFHVWSKRYPLEDHIADILQVACPVLVP